jgi:hypothetical protein
MYKTAKQRNELHKDEQDLNIKTRRFFKQQEERRFLEASLRWGRAYLMMVDGERTSVGLLELSELIADIKNPQKMYDLNIQMAD